MSSDILCKPLDFDELLQLRLVLEDPRTMVAFRQAAFALLADATYQNWLTVQRYKGGSFHLEGATIEKSFFHKLGLVGDDNYLRAQIHQYREKLFLTDTPNVPGDIQVYPWDDESDAIIGWLAQQQHWIDWADCTVDPMCGAGHHNIVLPGTVSSRLSFDVNARAVGFTDINALLNEVAVHTSQIDIWQGLADTMAESGIRKDTRILIMVNSPFGLSPLPGALPLTSDGGETGAVIAKAALKTVRELSNQYARIRLCQLVYTIGNPLTGSWYVVDFARELFGEDRVNFHLLSERSLWRVNGKKEEPNPMPLAQLRRKAFCAFQVKGEMEQRMKMAESYDALADRLHEQFDATHLGYGIIDVDMIEV